jgi:hypothetical protein
VSGAVSAIKVPMAFGAASAGAQAEAVNEAFARAAQESR